MSVKFKSLLSIPRSRHFHLSPNPNPYLHFLSTSTTLSPPTPPPEPDLINKLCRILSDYRDPHADLFTALSPYSTLLSPAAAAAVLRRCRHLPIPCLRFFRFTSSLEGFHHDPSSISVLAASLAAARQFALLRSLLSDLSSSHITPALFPLLFRSYSRAGLPDDAIRVFNSMAGFGFAPSLADLHFLLLALCRHGLVIHAEEFFREMVSEFAFSAKSYTILILGWGVAGKSGNARKLFDEMVERGIEPDVPAYNALIDALCRDGEIESARERLKEMQRERGLFPDAATYGAFLRAACAAGDLRGALRVLDQTRARGLTPNVLTYNSVVRLLCEKGEVEEAYTMLDEMSERGEKPDVWTYNAVLNKHCRLKEVKKALRLIERMDKDSCLPDRHTYNMLLKMLVRVGRFDRATEIWEGMECRGFHPGAATYAVMIHGLCQKKGMVEEACDYFERMVDEGIPPYLATCELLKERLLSLGLRERLVVLMDRMQRSPSCTIQELSSVMDGRRRAKSQEQKEPNSLEDEVP